MKLAMTMTAVNEINNTLRSKLFTQTAISGAAKAPMIAGKVMTKPAVPTLTCKSCAIAFRTPIGKNSLVTRMNAVIERVITAYQLPSVLGAWALGTSSSGFWC